ncbi:MAG TPA: NlpC/P60 family protein [Acidimicrobiales bacterium]|jgi:cell wall-associated NlpC family hydrolase|nr:NlpC/P60 family protein [Acidimicrobiales bacterium]
MTVVTVCSGTVVVVSRPAAGDSLSSARSKAAAITAELTKEQNEMSALSQQYDAAKSHLDQINASIATTKASIANDRKQVSGDKVVLSKAAVSNYVTDGAAASNNSIFSSGSTKTMGAATEYNAIAEGDINAAVASLHTAQNTLTQQESQLQTQQTAASDALASEQAAINQNAQVEQQQKNALAQENGQIAGLVKAAELQAVKASQAVTATRIATSRTTSATFAGLHNAAPPPTAAGGAGALQAAESQIGVPYVWAAESPKGSSYPGFDCSGLTAWSWGRVGVGLPHYSGGQMSDSTPVPLSDLQPGDLLFYGPGGSEHVAMYVGPGTMIEAPDTGSYVHITALRLGGDFVGAGRP